MSKYRYPFTHSMVFALVMRDPELCKGLLQLIFADREIAEVRNHDQDLSTEKILLSGVETKPIRLDVLFKDSDAWYDIEMQTRKEVFLPRRSRYYHSMMDQQSLKAGQSYEDLHDSFVIFICDYDPFGLGAPEYRFLSYDSTMDLCLDEGRYTIILNSRADESITPPALMKLFRYMNETVITDDDPLLRKIDDSVQFWNVGEGEKTIMTYEQEMEIRERRKFKEGREEGLVQGREEGREEAQVSIAQELKKEGVAPELIMKCTGLTKEAIDAL